MAASQLHGGHGSPLPAYKLWPGSTIRVNGGLVYVLAVDEAPDFEGKPQVAIRYRVDFAGGTHLIGVSQVNALRSFDLIDNPDPF